MRKYLSTLSRTTHFSRRLLHSSSPLFNATGTHTTDSYAKDVDSTPASDSKVHRVDPNSDHVQKPYEAPSGPWSRAGVQAGVQTPGEYQAASKTQPYAAPGEDRRDGGKEQYADEKGPETSHPGDGPEGKESGGRKPEGR